MKKPVIIVTGVAGGIGYATARIFSERGWHVIGTDIRQPDETAHIDQFIETDISRVENVPPIFDGLEYVTALVNSAAVQINKPLVETEPEEWDLLMHINNRAMYLMIRAAYPLMKTDGGSIINIGSVHARATSANIAAYATSKGAVSVMTRALAIELAPDNIRVNTLLPGAVDTPMLRSGLRRGHLDGADDDRLLADLGRKHLVGRIGLPDEMAKAVYFLADSEQSGFMTGAELVIDGGATIRLSTE